MVTSLDLLFNFILGLAAEVELLWREAPGLVEVVIGPTSKQPSHGQQDVMPGSPIDDEKLPKTVFGELPLTRQLDEEELPTLRVLPSGMVEPNSMDELGRPWARPPGKP